MRWGGGGGGGGSKVCKIYLNKFINHSSWHSMCSRYKRWGTDGITVWIHYLFTCEFLIIWQVWHVLFWGSFNHYTLHGIRIRGYIIWCYIFMCISLFWFCSCKRKQLLDTNITNINHFQDFLIGEYSIIEIHW